MYLPFTKPFNGSLNQVGIATTPSIIKDGAYSVEMITTDKDGKKYIAEDSVYVDYQASTLNSNTQTYYAKKIANKMADLVEAVIAIEAAKDHVRKEYIAKVIIQERYQKDELNKDPVTIRYFDEIVNYMKNNEIELCRYSI